MNTETLTEIVALERLRELAAQTPSDTACVEIGVYQGGSLRVIVEGAAAGLGAPVFGIDSWGLEGAYEGRPHMHRRYRHRDMEIAMETARGATFQRALSTDAAATWTVGLKVGLLYIDGEHTHDSVLRDFTAWDVHLADNATVVFDDYYDRFPGVVSAVDSLVLNGSLSWLELVGRRMAVTRRADK